MTDAMTFETADAAVEQLISDGFVRTDYDPIYPFMIAWNDGDGMMARVKWDDRRERYIIDGAYL